MLFISAALPVLALGALQGTSAQPEPDGARFGRSILAMSDLNDDGVREIAVGAPAARNGVGAVLILSGKTREVTAVWHGSPTRTGFAHTLRSVPDVNGDGVDDVLVGFEFWERTELRSGKDGEVIHAVDQNWTHVIPFGDFDGDGAGDLLLTTTPYWEVRSGSTNELLDRRTLSPGVGRFDAIGDVNGDGLVDGIFFGKEVVTKLSSRSKEEDTALGSPFGQLVARPRAIADLWPDSLAGTAKEEVRLLRAASAGDLDGDGHGDVLVITESGKTQAVIGLSFKKPGAVLFTAKRPSADPFFAEEPALGYASLGGLNLNGDACADTLLANPSDFRGRGQVVAAMGCKGTALEQHKKKWPAFEGAQWRMEMPNEPVACGLSFAAFDDIDGDGIQDVLVGNSDWIWSGTVLRVGSVRLLSGQTGEELWVVKEDAYEELRND